MNRYARWFRAAIWLGIVLNCSLAVPGIFAPETLINLMGLRPTGDPVWTAFAANLLVLLSILYIPGGMNPYRHQFTAWAAVLARVAGVIFFWVLYPGTYPLFGWLDFTMFAIQAPLLVLTMRHRPQEV